MREIEREREIDVDGESKRRENILVENILVIGKER